MKTQRQIIGGLLPGRLAGEFEDWVYTRRDDADIASLIAVHESGEFGPQIYAGPYRLSPAQRAAVREKAIHLIVARGPMHFRIESVVWRTDGKRLYATMAEAKR